MESKLSDGINVASLVRCLVYGRKDDVCRVCYGNTDVGAVNLGDSVLLEKAYCPTTVTFAEILTAITGSAIANEELLPQTVCSSCITPAICSYVFQNLCRHSADTLKNVYDSIESTVTISETLGPNVKIVYSTINGKETKLFFDEGRKVARKRVAKRMEALLTNEKSIKKEFDYQCSDCGRFFPSKQTFQRHILDHTNMFNCDSCMNSYNTQKKLSLHRARVHDEKKYKCPNCEKLFGSEYLVEEHRKAMHMYGKCHVCGKAFTNKHALRSHQLSHGSRWPCRRCGKEFKYKEGLKRHSVKCIDGTDKEFVCNECGKKYSTKGTIAQHIRHAHSDNPLKCDYCHKTFMDSGKLMCHLSNHTGVKRFQCRLCNAFFKYPTTLTYHMRAYHTFERPYPCNECDMHFITSSVRLAHKRRYHGAPAPSCDVCGARFMTNKRLRIHKKKHISDNLVDQNNLYKIEMV